MVSKTDCVAVFKKIGYTFKDYKLLDLALTHRSFAQVNNERLEFLGDSLVNLFMGEALFLKFPNMREGQLSRMRADLVKEETLAQIALMLGLDVDIKLGAGEHKTGGKHRFSILADTLEATIAAIYLDSDFHTAKNCVLTWFKHKLNNLIASDETKDHKSYLQECMQAQKKPLPEYLVVQIKGKAHEQIFKVECKLNLETDKKFIGEARTKRLAEQLAAQMALKELHLHK